MDNKLLLPGLLGALLASQAGAANYTFTTLNFPGARTTLATGINDSGQMTGYYWDASGRYRSFVESGGTFTALNGRGFNNYAQGINDNGQVTGWYEMNGPQDCWWGCGPDYNGFVASDATVTTLHFPYIPGGSAPTALTGINDSGQVTGYYLDPRNNWGNHGFVESGGAFTTLDVPGAFQTHAEGINDSGQVAGSYRDASRKSHGFVESGGKFTTLDVPGALNFDPLYYLYPGTSAYGINDSGQVVGYYSNALDTHGFVATIAPPVPEPEEWAMMLIGVGLVGLQVRRKQANRLAC